VERQKRSNVSCRPAWTGNPTRSIGFCSSARPFFLLAWLIVSPQVANAATSPQASIPPGWQTYTNPIYAYQIAYPPSWHHWRSDPRVSQYLSNYDETIADPDFPAAGTETKVEISPYQKSASESLDQWLQREIADFWPGGPPYKDGFWTPPAVQRSLNIAGHAATVLRWHNQALQATAQYLDVGVVVFKVMAGWSTGADAQLAQQVLDSFRITGTADLTKAAFPPVVSRPQPLVGTSSAGLNLPLSVNYTWYGTSTVAMKAGGVNSRYDHDNAVTGDYNCNNSMTRFDGQVFSPNWCSTTGSGSCTTSVSCYDGHAGIDFSTRGQMDIPVYAANIGTISAYTDNFGCGTGLTISTTVAGHAITLLYCHLDTRLVTSGTVYRGEQIALSGCSGLPTCAPHLHFGVYNNGHSFDPFGWCGSGSDPDPNDLGYLWSAGSTSPGNCGNAYPTFIGRPVYTVAAFLSGSWDGPHSDDAYSQTYWFTTSSAATARWTAPNINGISCYGAEAYVPSVNATNTNAQYVIHFSDGTADKTVTVNQNNQMTWYTLYDIYNGGHPIFSIQLTGAGGGKTAETNMWFQCF
jgi:hypothetical protein